MKENRIIRSKICHYFTLIIIIAVFFIICSPKNVVAAYQIDGGECWTNIEWALDSDYTLTCTAGSGANHKIGDTPWEEYKDRIKKIVIGSDITEISESTFKDYTSLEEMRLPST